MKSLALAVLFSALAVFLTAHRDTGGGLLQARPHAVEERGRRHPVEVRGQQIGRRCGRKPERVEVALTGAAAPGAVGPPLLRPRGGRRRTAFTGRVPPEVKLGDGRGDVCRRMEDAASVSGQLTLDGRNLVTGQAAIDSGIETASSANVEITRS